MNTELVTLDFQGRAIAAYLVDGSRHALSDEQAGTLLGYATPAESVSKLVQRDVYGELDGLAVQVRLTSTDGKRYSKRVWGRDGVIALAMLSSTETGAQVRVWARKALMDKADQVNAALSTGTERPSAQLREARGVFNAALGIAKLLRLEGNQAQIRAMQITKAKTGIDVAELFEVKMIAETQAMHLSPTQIGKRLTPAQSPIQVNKLLAALGAQAKEDGVWIGVEAHQEHWEYKDDPRAHTTGSVRSLRWFPSIVPLLQAHLSA